jgi:hypothetical protein
MLFMKKGRESHHLIHDEENRWHTTPLGMKILTIYTSVLALLYLFFSIVIPTNVFFGVIALGNAARVLNLVFLCILVAIIIGLLMKKHWAGGVACGFFIFEILNLAVSLIVRRNLLENTLVIMTSVIIVALNSLILWYIYKKREYFTDLRHFKSGKADKMFIIGIISLAAVLLLSACVYAAGIYKTTISLTNNIIDGMKGMAKDDALQKCSSYEGKEKDICYVVVAAAYTDVAEQVCDYVDDNFYRLACIQAVMA